MNALEGDSQTLALRQLVEAALEREGWLKSVDKRRGVPISDADRLWRGEQVDEVIAEAIKAFPRLDWRASAASRQLNEFVSVAVWKVQSRGHTFAGSAEWFLAGRRPDHYPARAPTPIVRASRAKRLWNRYYVTIAALTVGIIVAYSSNVLVTSPEHVLSAPDSFISTPFEFRYAHLANTQVLTTDQEKALVVLDLSIQGQPFKAYRATTPALVKELRRTKELFLVKGNYEKKSERYVLSEVTIAYPWWGVSNAIFYLATQLMFNYRIAVMTASFGGWLILIIIWTVFKMSVSEEIGELSDSAKDVLDEL